MMRLTRVFLAANVLLLCSACGVDLTCEDPQGYEFARAGARVSVPSDLDPLETSREQPIPKASPRDPRPAGSPCLDLPPTLRGRSSTDENDEGIGANGEQ